MPSSNIMDGNTAAMRSLALTQMDPNTMQSAQVTCGALDGCKNFSQADNEAAQKLITFVSATANPTIEQYNKVANLSGLAYQDAAEAGRAAIVGVEWDGPREIGPGGN